ncbi:N-terminal nucleophile aminohydrolase [Lojkania enalia]|uniref:N-terminal nucleophile aminohydrolase n=1 Tax=Lojkania enalia TaxID=147567 RepID=A0A9P4K6N0_9PLEO|nr:N-terminal nucleophile aminohydrolase [Didymosphaeria enalia]
MLSRQTNVKPRIIIHGGAGNITRNSIPKDRYDAYIKSLREILASSAELLSAPGATALDIATYAVTLLENDPLYNSGKGAVFTRGGTNELECSIMVSNGYRKRGVGCMMIRHIKNPIKLARELLLRGEEVDGGGAQDHCQYSGEYVERLAKGWGLEMVDPSYFYTKGRWEEHRKGLKEEELKREKAANLRQNGVDIDFDEPSEWEKTHYIPLGTCGAVVLDRFGTICVATSTGGLTNKLPGRIGDTPTIGAGFWAEEWFEESTTSPIKMVYQTLPQLTSPLNKLSRGDLAGLLGDCLPSTSPHVSSASVSALPIIERQPDTKPTPTRHAVAMSGTGNGDTFLRMAACRTTAAKAHFTPTSLSTAITWMTGPGGELQKSAGDRWGHVHEGVGGIIGIELAGEKAEVVWDYNCGGMFRAWTEEDGSQKCLIFREENWESGPEI